MEEWRPINEFYGYSVSDHGRVLNTKSGRIMALTENQKSLVIVGLMRGGIQHKRSVSRLVADAYLPTPEFASFDSIINKDGVRQNNFATNLAWRPRWFTLKYHNQFRHRVMSNSLVPIAEMGTGEEFENVWAAVEKYGLLVNDIIESMRYQTYVWPTHQRFWRLD
jgi:NUMOD4 motif-containing protein